MIKPFLIVLLRTFEATRKKYFIGLCAGKARHSLPHYYFFRVTWADIAARSFAVGRLPHRLVGSPHRPAGCNHRPAPLTHSS